MIPKHFSILLKDNNGKFISYLENKIDIASLSWEWNRIGGCGACDLKINESWDAEIVGSLTEDYEINIYAPPVLGGTAELWYSGFIDRVSPSVAGNIEQVSISCLGYVNQLKKVIVKDREYIGYEISRAVNDVVNSYVCPITNIINSELDDPYNSFLAPFDGAQGSTMFTDVFGHTLIGTGTAANRYISSIDPKFGSGSLFCSNGAGAVRLTKDSCFDFGTGDFTIDFWVKFSQVTEMYFIKCYEDAYNFWQIWYDANSFDRLRIQFFSGGVWKARILTASAISFDINRWYHLCFERYGTTAKIFIDGISQTLSTIDTTAFGTNDVGIVNADIIIPWLIAGSGGLYGYYDEFRICKGIARYTADFVPRTKAYSFNYDLTDFSMDRIYFDETAYEAISKLADIAGQREWGVDADKIFYFKKRDNNITRWINITEKGIRFTPEKDFNPVITKIYLLGGEGYEANFSITNKKSIKEELVSNSAIVTQSVGQQFARMYLKEKGVPSRSYSLDLAGYNQRIESTVPLGKVALFEKKGLQSRYDTTAKYDSDIKYDGGVESFQIERIKYTLTEDGINVSLTLGTSLPSIVDDMAKMEYLISSERNR